MSTGRILTTALVIGAGYWLLNRAKATAGAVPVAQALSGMDDVVGLGFAWNFKRPNFSWFNKRPSVPSFRRAQSRTPFRRAQSHSTPTTTPVPANGGNALFIPTAAPLYASPPGLEWAAATTEGPINAWGRPPGRPTNAGGHVKIPMAPSAYADRPGYYSPYQRPYTVRPVYAGGYNK